MELLSNSRLGQYGVTLIELLVVMSIAAILMAIGVPTYQTVVNEDRIAAEINDLSGDVAFARTAAVGRGVPVTICASTAPSAANPVCSNPGAALADWVTGWVVFTDVKANHTFTASDTVLRYHPPLTSSDTLSGMGGTIGNLTGTPQGSFTFNRMGADTSPGVITVHDAGNTMAWRRCLVVPMSGEATVDSASTCP